MKITVTERAAKWFSEEVGVESGEQVRFYAQFYGTSKVQEVYSLGFSRETPIDAVMSTEVDGIQFFVENGDEWFFNEHDVLVEYNPDEDMLEYEYTLDPSLVVEKDPNKPVNMQPEYLNFLKKFADSTTSASPKESR